MTSVAAQDVKVGDYLYNKLGFCKQAMWVKVTKITKLEAYINITTNVFSTLKHPLEGVSTRREK